MNLDDTTAFLKIDTNNMIELIDSLPQQLLEAWQVSKDYPLPIWKNVRQVLICGLGGSAIAADLLTAWLEPQCKVPLFVHRNYELPAWAGGEETVVIASSHSGNTEEVLTSFQRAIDQRCRVIALTRGGELARLANQKDIPVWVIHHPGPPRAAVGYSFGLLLSIVARLHLINDPSAEVEAAVEAMRQHQQWLKPAVPLAQNPAKRLAGQLLNRWVVFLAADFLAPVARRWKGQVNELAKAWAEFEVLPEADHNTLAGLLHPENNLSHFMAVFLRSSLYHQRNILRTDLTKQAFLCEGLNIDFYEPRGNTALTQQWVALHFGDYLAYYLAMLYEVDPTPIDALEEFKRSLQEA